LRPRDAKAFALDLQECEAAIRVVDETGVQVIVGHTASYKPGILRARQLVESDRFGRLSWISIAAYTPYLYRPRRPEELDTNLGGGVIFNQAPHQVDAARLLGGGLVKSVRATTSVLDSRRPTEGQYMAMLFSETGVSASLTYSGYDHFDTTEFGVTTSDPRSIPQTDSGRFRREIESRQPGERELLAPNRGIKETVG
jgi:phthalate 4,5-cis-dihydrodiol dehydrogenase